MKHPRSWIWLGLIVQWLGFAYDIVWHGFIRPNFEATTVRGMVHHLGTVHVPLYLGVALTFLAAGWALIDHVQHGAHGIGIPIAFAGAVMQVIGEGWHASSHLHLSTHVGPLAFSLSFLGMLIVLGALLFSGHAGRGAPRLLTHS